MALGLHAAGFEHRLLVEWWAPAARVLRRNAERDSRLWSTDAVVEQDVRAAGQQINGAGAIDLVAGGPPCQPFSLAGVHAGDSDERNMFPAALDVLRATRPKLVIFENVPGLTRSGFSAYLEYVKAQIAHPEIGACDGELWHEHHSRILQSRHTAEYFVHQYLIDAADVGVAQNRRRVFLVGIRSDIDGASDWSGIDLTHHRDVLLHQQYISGEYWDRHGLRRRRPSRRLEPLVARIAQAGVPLDRRPWVTLRDVLADVPPPTIRARDGWPNHIAIPGARTYPGHTGSPIDLPSKTIKAGVHGVSGGEAMIRNVNGHVRYLTVREAALAQGFPRNYEFPGPRSRVMGVIGNAVSVGVAAALGMSLRRLAGV